MRYRKVVGERKYIENDFYGNDSPNNDLESQLHKNRFTYLFTFQQFFISREQYRESFSSSIFG